MEALRARALDALGSHGDPLAEEVLRGAEIVVLRGLSTWEGSAGRVEGHGVALGLGAGELGAALGSARTTDALAAALAASLAGEPGKAPESLAELRLFWSPAGRRDAGVYRDAPLEHVPLPGAMEAFLRAQGEDRAAELAARARVDVLFTNEGAKVTVAAVPNEPRGRSAIEACLRALLWGVDGRDVQVRWTRGRASREP